MAAMRMDEKAHPDEYFQLTKRACDLGNAEGCSDHGFAYFSALGTPQDLAKALFYYRKACDGGNELGCSNAGFNREKATPPDFAAASAFFDRACPRDGKEHDKGLCAKATAYFGRRCDAGDKAACARAAADH
jgi:hypothetical protein